MIKLYKRSGRRVTHYREAWIQGSMITEHWGTLGEKGEIQRHRVKKGLGEEDNLALVLADARSAGFELIDTDEHRVLLIEYPVDGMGAPDDVDKRYRLQDRMDETLGWTGLGNCDGGSIGSGTMEVCCFVVDFEVAKRVIAEDLKGTEFEDYSRIYDGLET